MSELDRRDQDVATNPYERFVADFEASLSPDERALHEALGDSFASERAAEEWARSEGQPDPIRARMVDPAREDCPHESASFDRSLCACGAMHDYCDDCGEALDCELSLSRNATATSLAEPEPGE